MASIHKDIMAAAEAGAAWQHSGNRFLHEDAKRTTKFARSSTGSTEPHSDPVAVDVGNDSEHHVSTFLSGKRNLSDVDIPCDAKWWMRDQTCVGIHKDILYGNLCEMSGKTFDKKLEDSQADLTEDGEKQEMKRNLEQDSILEGYSKNSNDRMSSQMYVKDEPWWCSADETELSTVVAKETTGHFENCEPSPQVATSLTSPIGIQRSTNGRTYSKPSAWHYHEPSQYCAGKASTQSKTVFPRSVPKNSDEMPSLAREFGSSWKSDYGRSLSSESASKILSDSKRSFDSDGKKAKLLEALCRSQTRAREAERAAAQAISEKEWLWRLLLKEASHLFAYKQWFRILQIETFCLQVKLKKQAVSWEHLRALVPWRPLKTQPHPASKRKSTKKYKNRKKKLNTWSFAVALGVGLTGAGLFIGWSIGWLMGVV